MADREVTYNDLEKEEKVTETFENVDDVSEVGNPDGIGQTIIVSHTDGRSNSVRDGVKLISVS